MDSTQDLIENDISSEDYLSHYGTPRHSGRYPWGSGDNPYQRNANWLSEYHTRKAKGMTDSEIAKDMGLTVTEFRQRRSAASAQLNAELVNTVRKLKDKGYSNVEIGRRMGINESSVRNYLKQIDNTRQDQAKETMTVLMNNVREKGYIDVGKGVELELGITRGKLDNALKALEDKGYSVQSVPLEQVTNNRRQTTIKVLYKTDPTVSEEENIKKAYKVVKTGQFQSINEYSADGGSTYHALEAPKSISSTRVMVRYAEDGGKEKDGVIELRRGVEDISLGNSSHAQVRIAVDGTHYLKGMAIYSDNMPDGVDIIFNTNKTKDVPMMGDKSNSVLKTMKKDPTNPFGALIRANGQRHYTDENGDDQLSVINIVKQEGDWDDYSKNLSAQFLSKQNQDLIKRQLNLAKSEKQAEYEDIQNVSNSAIKKKLLIDFADGCDKAAEDLKAASLPRQSSKVILPVTTLKDNEVYAPTYKNGETLYLVRYPHAGTFEIPTLTVNNNNREGKKVVGNNSIDAIGINSAVASKLSGADFDGDSVIVIPANDSIKIKATATPASLKNFDPSEAYPKYEGMKVMSEDHKQIQMGVVSNLITDMTLKGADQEKIVRAVKHSMVVIDAVKHELNYKQSYIDNGIAALQKEYQSGGASTIVSRAGSTSRVPERKVTNAADTKYIDKKTGERIYEETGRTYTDKKGNTVLATEEVSRMSLVKDANELSTGNAVEELYASYANNMKALANSARKEYLSVESTPRNTSATQVYASEVASLKAKLTTAQMNAPRERMAQGIATATIKQAKKDNPDMTKEEYKKTKDRAISQARSQVGANKRNVQVEITDKEWEAIDAGAVAPTMLTSIINNTDLESLKSHVYNNNTTKLSSTKQNMIKTMSKSGYTIAEIADHLGISTSTVSNYIK